MREKRDLAIQAMRGALDRAQSARTAGDFESLFAPLAEALWWVVVLNDSYWNAPTGASYRRLRQADSRGQLLEGLRYARNRLTHDIDITGMHGLIEGADLPFNLPAGPGGWVWRQVADLPSVRPGQDVGEATYRRSLEGRSVEQALRLAADFLSSCSVT